MKALKWSKQLYQLLFSFNIIQRSTLTSSWHLVTCIAHIECCTFQDPKDMHFQTFSNFFGVYPSKNKQRAANGEHKKKIKVILEKHKFQYSESFTKLVKILWTIPSFTFFTLHLRFPALFAHCLLHHHQHKVLGFVTLSSMKSNVMTDSDCILIACPQFSAFPVRVKVFLKPRPKVRGG